MQGFLLPSETLLLQEECFKGTEYGILLVTNSRLLWKRMGDMYPQLNTSLLNVGPQVGIAKAKDRETWILNVPISGLKKPILLKFEKEKCE